MYSRSGGEGPRHASGVLDADQPDQPGRSAHLSQWPPTGAVPVDLTGFYAELAADGYGYGPAFQGLRAAWRRGDDVYAEVVLTEQGGGYGLYPALLDAALHSIFILTRARGEMVLPFSWSGVSLYAAGASTLRVHMTPTGPDAVSLTLADTTGQPVASIDSVVLRPVSPEQLRSARRDALPEHDAFDVRNTLGDLREPVPGGSGGPGVAPRADTASLRDHLAGLPEAEQGELLLGLVRAQVAAVLGHSSPDAVDAGRVFRDLGFDSLAAAELRERLVAATGLLLPVSTVFGHPTAVALADHLRVALVGAPTNLSDELDRIEVALSRLSRDDDTLGTVTARLAALLDKYGALIEKSADAAEAVASATDDELFTFIDNHL